MKEQFVPLAADTSIVHGPKSLSHLYSDEQRGLARQEDQC